MSTRTWILLLGLFSWGIFVWVPTPYGDEILVNPPRAEVQRVEPPRIPRLVLHRVR